MTELRTTPLHDLHVELGARLVDFADWNMPVWYGGATDEHHAVRNAGGLFDLSHMAELLVRGPEAAPALDHALLVDASAMAVGRARYTMMCNPEGGIVDDLIVYRLADDEFLVVANASNGAVVHAELVARSASADATVDDATDAFALVAIQGPVSERVLAELTDLDLAALRYYRIERGTVDGVEALVARTGYTGEDGFELYLPAEDAKAVWRAIAAAGQTSGIVPVGLAARDTLRLEAGMPLYGNELTENTTPYDVGAARLVVDKSVDFVGRAALAEAAGAPHRHLVGLLVDGRRPARAGYEVRIGDRPAGQVTSGALSPTLERAIALASVDEPLGPGAAVEIDVRGTPTRATVTELPFYSRGA